MYLPNQHIVWSKKNNFSLAFPCVVTKLVGTYKNTKLRALHLYRMIKNIITCNTNRVHPWKMVVAYGWRDYHSCLLHLELAFIPTYYSIAPRRFKQKRLPSRVELKNLRDWLLDYDEWAKQILKQCKGCASCPENNHVIVALLAIRSQKRWAWIWGGGR